MSLAVVVGHMWTAYLHRVDKINSGRNFLYYAHEHLQFLDLAMAISMKEENYTCPDKNRLAIRARVLICWEHITLRFNSSGGTHISEGVAGDICSGKQKIRGNTYLHYSGNDNLRVR